MAFINIIAASNSNLNLIINILHLRCGKVGVFFYCDIYCTKHGRDRITPRKTRHR